ncbi:MAG TPA: hypothetical protein VFM05_08675 [Candidatus Saccharimonadales bacterium]|nr:hypothetical protein [Candidatus Saccharimonadales bacterium]
MSRPTWYLDIRTASTPELISLDLTRHLPRRLAVGPAIIVSDQPDILLPVVRKRWMRILLEVKKQFSSTLDRNKKRELSREVERMHAFIFTTKLDESHADVFIIHPVQTLRNLPAYSSLYILAPLTQEQFLSVSECAQPNALVAVYGEWNTYERALRASLGQLHH